MKKTIRDVEWGDKRAVMRCDFNVPLDGDRITDDTRIQAALPSIDYLLDDGTKLELSVLREKVELSKYGKGRKKVIKDKIVREKYPDAEKIVFLHYPPVYANEMVPNIISVLKQYGVKKVYYGHLHGPSHGLAMEGLWDDIDFRLVSADYLNFKPIKVIP